MWYDSLVLAEVSVISKCLEPIIVKLYSASHCFILPLEKDVKVCLTRPALDSRAALNLRPALHYITLSSGALHGPFSWPPN